MSSAYILRIFKIRPAFLYESRPLRSVRQPRLFSLFIQYKHGGPQIPLNLFLSARVTAISAFTNSELICHAFASSELICRAFATSELIDRAFATSELICQSSLTSCSSGM